MTTAEPTDSAVVATARQIADDVLAPAAEGVDTAEVVPAEHLRHLARAGLFGLAGPTAAGGLDAEPRVFRRAVAAIGGGCGATFFVWVQHHGVVGLLRSSDSARARSLLPDLCRGRLLAGTAFAHVRRSTSPVTARQRPDGSWQVTGAAPWATSWGIADWFSVAATVGDRLVWAMVPADAAGITARPLPLPVLGATRTVSIELDLVVPAERVVDVADLAAWRDADARRAAMAQPASLGVAERASRVLAEVGDDDAVAAAGRLDRRRGALWDRDDELVEAAAAGADVRQVAAAHRAQVLEHAQDATRALLAAVGGRGMALDHPAQRLAREATFYVIQAQTGDGRAATLAAAGT